MIWTLIVVYFILRRRILPLFDRVISVKTGKQGIENVLNVSNLRVIFKIKKTKKTTENGCELEIYNLNENSRNLFSTIGNFIHLEAGYYQGEGLALMFLGSIVDYEIVIAPPNVITKVKAKDGLAATQGKTFNASYNPNAIAGNVLTDIAKSLGIPQKLTDKVKSILDSKNKRFTNGLVLSGDTKKALNQISEFLGIEWSIQNNVLKFVGKDLTDESQVIKLNSQSGLIGSPVKKSKLSDQTKKNGYEINSLLNAYYEPTKPIVIESKNLSSTVFRIEEVTHIGDTYGNDWNSKLLVSEVA